MRRVLVTGPLESASEYAQAARHAGWEAIEWPLLRVVPHRHDVAALLAERFDWICITSSSALPFLADLCRARSTMRSTPCAIVGARSARRARELGFRIELVAASSAELCAELARRAPGGARVLWPRGHLSDELACDLRRSSLVVEDPVVYATLAIERKSAAPACEAVFFASPSAVRAWSDDERTSGRRIAIAIGSTTFDALMSATDPAFFDTISLPEPTPEAFAFVLAHLDIGPAEPTS